MSYQPTDASLFRFGGARAGPSGRTARSRGVSGDPFHRFAGIRSGTSDREKRMPSRRAFLALIGGSLRRVRRFGESDRVSALRANGRAEGDSHPVSRSSSMSAPRGAYNAACSQRLIRDRSDRSENLDWRRQFNDRVGEFLPWRDFRQEREAPVANAQPIPIGALPNPGG